MRLIWKESQQIYFLLFFSLSAVFILRASLILICCIRHGRIRKEKPSSSSSSIQYFCGFSSLAEFLLRQVIAVKDFELFKKVSRVLKRRTIWESLKWLNESYLTCVYMNIYWVSIGRGSNEHFHLKNKLLDHELDWLSTEIIHLKPERTCWVIIKCWVFWSHTSTFLSSYYSLILFIKFNRSYFIFSAIYPKRINVVSSGNSAQILIFYTLTLSTEEA